MSNLVQAKAKVSKLIQAIRPYDELEQAHITNALLWVDNSINIFRIARPDKPSKHLVSYFMLVDREHGSLLLVDHINAQLWLPSGGHVELGEDPKDTVSRESWEELDREAVFLDGLDRPFFITQGQTVGLTAGHTDVSLWYLLQGDIHDKVNFDHREFKSVRWLTFQEVLATDPATLDPHLQRFTKKLVDYLSDESK